MTGATLSPQLQVLLAGPSRQWLVSATGGLRKDNRWTGEWAHQGSWMCVESKDWPVLSNPKVELRSRAQAQEANLKLKSLKQVHAGFDRKVSEHIAVHRSLLCMGLCSHRLVKVPMLTPAHCRKYQKCACEHQNWRFWKEVAWFDESCSVTDGDGTRIP